MLENNPGVFVLVVDRLGEPRKGASEFVVGDDPASIKRIEERDIRGLLQEQSAPRFFQLIAKALQLFAEPVPSRADDATQEWDIAGGDREGDSPAATRRVIGSHEECTLLVVRPSVGVTAPAGGRFVVVTQSTTNCCGTLDSWGKATCP